MSPPKISLLIAGLLICMLCIGVSAESFEEEYDESVNSNTHSSEYISGSVQQVNGIYYMDYASPSLYRGLFFMTYDGGPVEITGCDENTNYRIRTYNGYTSQLVIEGTISYDNDYNWLGDKTNGYIWIHVDQMHYGNVSGNVYSKFEILASNGSVLTSSMAIGRYQGATWSNTNIGRIYFTGSAIDFDYGMSLYYENEWESSVSGVYGADETFSSISLTRNGYLSNFTIYDLSGNIIRSDYSTRDLDGYIFDEESYSYLLENQFGTEFSKILQVAEPAPETINVHTSVRDTSTNALISGANVTYYPLDTADADPVSHVLEYGDYSFSLTPGEHYNYTADATGYRTLTTQPIYWGMCMGDTDNVIYMTPVSGNVTAGQGTLNFYVKTYSDTSGDLYEPVPGAVIQIDNKTLITNDAGYAQTEVSKTAPITYTVTKTDYISVTRTYTPAWTSDVTDEYVRLRGVDLVLDGEAAPAPTQDTRSTNQKAEAAFEIFFDNVECFASMACFILFLSFIAWMTPKKR